MKHYLRLFPILCMLLSAGWLAAQPQGINYQAVVRSSSGNILANASLAVQFQIRRDSPGGVVVFSETHQTTSTAQGLVNLPLGQGSTLAGDFGLIDWGSAAHYLQVLVDTGTGLTDLGTTPLLSVPYALYARRSAIDSVNDADADPANELQSLTRTGATLALSGGGGSVSVDDVDADPANELQTLTRAGATLSLSGGGGSVSVDDADADPTNERQTLSVSGNTLSISQGNSVALPGFWLDLGPVLVPAAGESITSGGDLVADATNGVLNTGGAANSNANVISDLTTPPISIATGDEDLFIEGDLEVTGTPYKLGGGTWATLSDSRLKTDIQPYTDGLAQVLAIRPVWYRYNATARGADPAQRYTGVLAQDLLRIAPYMVREQRLFEEVAEVRNGEDEVLVPGQPYYTVDASALTYMLINAVQTQQQQIEALQAEVKALRACVDADE